MTMALAKSRFSGPKKKSDHHRWKIGSIMASGYAANNLALFLRRSIFLETSSKPEKKNGKKNLGEESSTGQGVSSHRSGQDPLFDRFFPESCGGSVRALGEFFCWVVVSI